MNIYSIPGCAGNVRHYYCLPSGNGIQQTGFAGIGRTDNNNAEPLAQAFADIVSLQMFAYRRGKFKYIVHHCIDDI